jgi:hypothetical protein
MAVPVFCQTHYATMATGRVEHADVWLTSHQLHQAWDADIAALVHRPLQLPRAAAVHRFDDGAEGTVRSV